MRGLGFHVVLVVLGALGAVAQARVTGQQPTQTVWRLDNLRMISGHAVKVIGNPKVVDTDIGAAIAFDGRDDGLLLDFNPLAGLKRFTVEILFQPAPDGTEEQRFLHMEEAGTGNRALIELRLPPAGQWSLDTYLRSGDSGLTLLDRGRTHSSGRWHVAALTYDGKVMRHFVDGREELSGDTAFAPLAAGRTSIGVRQNLISWFKGMVYSIRISSEALPSAQLMNVPTAKNLVSKQVIPLWPEGVPGAKDDGGDERIVDGRVYNVQRPALIYIEPASHATGTAVVICPGGSYARLAISNEAEGVAARLSSAGVASFILKYRLAEYGHPAPLQDVLRAIRLLRSKAADFGIAPDRIGVFGASAGGHVAASAATLFDAPEGRTGSPLDAVSARPDFVALLYPVITMTSPLAHAESRRNLLGSNPGPDITARTSLEHQMRADAPPLFIVHTAEDRSVLLEHSLLFYQAARRAGVPAELHLYERGPHGFGVGADLGPTSAWMDRWMDWLRLHAFLPSPPGNGS
jgi:acetyl esterase/lipase